MTRQHILDSALALMARRGFSATTMRELAAACGCNVAILYRHFASKEAILEAIVTERRHRVFDRPAPVAVGANTVETLTALFTALLDRDIEYEYIYRVFLGEGMRSNPAVVALRDELWHDTERAYTRWLRELFPSLRRRRDVGAIARTLRTLVQGAYGELVMAQGERPKAARARAREMARVLAPVLDAHADPGVAQR
ncbi:MAG: TetR/AcrR family transcriptional regulator [Acidimicrobiales bacterium]|nr:TetR/AcrR family transcriptional regulator [Acidimicrobiales bacterium]